MNHPVRSHLDERNLGDRRKQILTDGHEGKGEPTGRGIAINKDDIVGHCCIWHCVVMIGEPVLRLLCGIERRRSCWGTTIPVPNVAVVL